MPAKPDLAAKRYSIWYRLNRATMLNTKPILFLVVANVVVIGFILRFTSCPVATKPTAESAVRLEHSNPMDGADATVATAAATSPPLPTTSAPQEKTLLQLHSCQRLGDSQGNQDCIIDRIFASIGTTNKFYVEYGFNTDQQCSNSGPNTCRLWKTHGWNGLLLDGSHTNSTINLHAHYLYANNMVALLEKYKVPKDLDFYSGDMDSHDYFVLKSVLDSGKFRPRLITTEYNQNYPAHWAVSQIDPTMAWPNQEPPPYKFQDCIWGASPAAFRFLMGKHGYQLVGVTTTLDLFWVRADVLESNSLVVPSYQDLIQQLAPTNPLHPPKQNPMFLSKLVDVQVYEETKNYRQANRAMVQTILNHIRSAAEPTIPCLRQIKAGDVEAYLEEHPPIGQHLDLS